MGYLRHARPAPSSPAPEHECVAAFDRELSYLFTTLRRLGARPPEIEDFAQEVFLVLHKNWASIDRSRPLRPYLFGVAFRVVAAHRRRRRREIPSDRVDVLDESVDPERLLERKQATAVLMAALDRVPLRRRAVLVMYETKLLRCVAYDENWLDDMVPCAFQGVAKTMAPAAMAALAVAPLAESGDPSLTGMRSAVKQKLPSPMPKASVRSAAVRSPAQAAWLMPPNPRLYCFWLVSVTVAVCASAGGPAHSAGTRARRRTTADLEVPRILRY
jgi:RNA polymerase sigma factor (sigma-70 family)